MPLEHGLYGRGLERYKRESPSIISTLMEGDGGREQGKKKHPQSIVVVVNWERDMTRAEGRSPASSVQGVSAQWNGRLQTKEPYTNSAVVTWKGT